MSKITCHATISLDGYSAGPDQSLENPLGVGGEQLHRWMFADPVDPADAPIVADLRDYPCSAYVMGRNMFGPIRGEWSGGVAPRAGTVIPRVPRGDHRLRL